MVRIKYTGPLSAVRSQHAQAPADAVSAPSTTPETQTQTAMNGHSESVSGKIRLLRQQQSLEMVKIMLHVTFGTLFYLREFLPLPCFDDRDLKETQRQQKFSYREFIDNKSSTDPAKGVSVSAFGKSRIGQPLKVIIRGSDPKADMIVNVLEAGIFDALSKSVLEAVQLTILVDKDAPENVLESYTFSFKYTRGIGDLQSRLESLSIEPFGYVADMKSAQTGRIALENIVRRLITLSAFLPTLPNKRTLGVNLFYTEDCPPDYEPPGFTGARDGPIHYPLTENWRRESQVCGRIETGWHTVGLKVTSLKWVGPEPEVSESLPQIPSQIEYNDTVPRTADIGFENEESMLQSSQSGGSSQEATQDIAERERLRLMMPPQEVPPPDSDLISTQPVKPMSALETESAEPPNSNPNPSPKPSKKFILPKRRIAEIRKSLVSWKPNGLKVSKLQKPGVIRCQCGWDGEEEAMLECSFCHTRQHLLCYGYEGVHQRNVPDVHACYQCLLEPNESQAFDEMEDLVLTRRALRVIVDEGFPSYTSVFAEKLHCGGPAIVRITNFLKEEGFLQPTFGYKAKGFMRKGLPKFSVPESEDIRQRIRQEIMDPMVKIKHHYTEQHFPDSLEVPSPPATSGADGRSKPSSQDKIEPTSSYETDRLETHNSTDKPTDTPRTTRSLRGSTIQSNMQRAPSNDDRSNVVLSTPQTINKGTPRSTRKRTESSQFGTKSSDTVLSTPQPNTKDAPRSTRKRTRSSQIGTAPHCITPSQPTTDHEAADDGVRRSGRKRRKISNYSKLIDIGAQTSGDENV
ncbi:HORMA domain-containing protein [Aspergillus cavernicola]|uniref:HORMA domain-containing protein n=1 Tax=Aspergillus cavernicola TaxID=176166 RepID=A0ABR4HH75_9EURO